MSKFVYLIPKLNYPKRGLIKTLRLEFQKFSALKKATFLTLIVLIFLRFIPWCFIGDQAIYSTGNIFSLIGIIIWIFLLSNAAVFALELFEIDNNYPKSWLAKWLAISGLQMFILHAIGFSISHNMKLLTQDANPYIGAFLGLLVSLIYFLETVSLYFYERPIEQTPRSHLLIKEENLEDTLDRYLEKRSLETFDEKKPLEPSKEQHTLFDLE